MSRFAMRWVQRTACRNRVLGQRGGGLGCDDIGYCGRGGFFHSSVARQGLSFSAILCAGNEKGAYRKDQPDVQEAAVGHVLKV